MKMTAFAAFIAFWSVTGTLLAVSALLPAPQATAQETVPVISLDELAAHATLEDCWMAIEGKVYDFSAYVPTHPAPPVVLTPWCGKEATEGMRTKGYGRDHSPAAWAMMEEYLVGTLAETE
jgi:cytochrome b involved in lipid metabolism